MQSKMLHTMDKQRSMLRKDHHDERCPKSNAVLARVNKTIATWPICFLSSFPLAFNCTRNYWIPVVCLFPSNNRMENLIYNESPLPPYDNWPPLFLSAIRATTLTDNGTPHVVCNKRVLLPAYQQLYPGRLYVPSPPCYDLSQYTKVK